MSLETHASRDRHLSLKDVARGLDNAWNPSAEACAIAEQIVANVERLRA